MTGGSGRVLVVDVGTSSVRAAIVAPDGTSHHEVARPALPDSPADGLVEFDAVAQAEVALACARDALDAAGAVDAVGVTAQRASTVVWDASSGEPVGPGLGWQDLRTVGRCLELRAAHGLRLAPNQSATKIEWLLDAADPNRDRALRVGTVDSWITWNLSAGATHVTDASNAAVTGVWAPTTGAWDPDALAALRIPADTLPPVVDTVGFVGEANALPGAPPITAIVGDQQASLAGQGCVRPGQAKITFGTGGMLDLVLGEEAPSLDGRGRAGTFPIVAWRLDGRITWGLEAIMLAAGTNVEWLRDDLGLIASAGESHDVAAACDDTGDVWFVPAPLGLGTPAWDYGARGVLIGVTRGTGRAEVVRAVLEGVAHRGADLVDAAEADAGLTVDVLRIDGGMSDNATFVQALADATRRPVEVSPVTEATTRGAGLLAAVGAGLVGDLDDLAQTWEPRVRVEPRAGHVPDRDRWQSAVDRSRHWIEGLSQIDF